MQKYSEPVGASSIISLNLGPSISISDADDEFLSEVKLAISNDTYLPDGANATDSFVFPSSYDGFNIVASDSGRLLTLTPQVSKTVAEFNNLIDNISIKIEGDDPTGLGLFPNRKIVIDATDLSGDKTSKELDVNINSSDDLPSLSLGTAGSVTDISVAIENIPLFTSAITFDDVDTRYDKFSIEMIGGLEGEDTLH